MRVWGTIFLITNLFSSCLSTSESKSINDRIIGQWKTERCSLHSVHGVIGVQLHDTLEIPIYRIKTNFLIKFQHDNLFSFENENGSTKLGKYKMTKHSLTFTLNNDSINWLTFSIDSITDSKLFLTSNSIQFYDKTTDSLCLFTGDNVALILKRK